MIGHQGLYWIIIVCLVSPACAPPALVPPEGEDNKPVKSSLSVDLPRQLPLTKKPMPELQNEDGTLRISGILARTEEYLQSSVIFKGYLLTAPAIPTEKNVRATSLVVKFSDNQAGEGALLSVTGIDHATAKRLEVGAQYVVTGTLEQAMNSSQGILSLKSIETAEAYKRAMDRAVRASAKQQKKK